MKNSREIDDLIALMGEAIDEGEARLALSEFGELEQRFSLGDWAPSECNAGRFCEAIVRPIEYLDREIRTSNAPSKVAVTLVNDDVPHNLNSVDRRNLSKVILSVYEIRSSRNSVHLAPGYTADYVDSMLTVSSCKWLLCELVRLATGVPNSQTAKTLAGLVTLRQPLVFMAGSRPVIMKTDLSAPQEILLHLLNKPEHRAAKVDLIVDLDGYHTSNSVTVALNRLVSKRYVAKDHDGVYWLTYLGANEATRLLKE